MFRTAFAIFLLGLLVGFLSLPKSSSAQDKMIDERGFVAVEPPHAVPNFLFEDESGRSLDLTQFRGHFVVLNLWATFCEPCVAEMPKLDELVAKLDKNRWILIALNEDHDGANVAHIFYKHQNIHHLKVYSDHSGRAPFVLQTRGLPTTLIINPRGEEIARLEGPADWTKDTMVAYLNARTAP